MSIVQHAAIPDNALLTPSDLEWLDGHGDEPDFSHLDPSGQPAVLTIVSVEAAPLYGEPIGFAAYIDGEAARFMARRAGGSDDETESLASFMARSEPIVSLGTFLGLELQAMAREVRAHKAATPAAWWKAVNVGPISRLDEVRCPGVAMGRSGPTRSGLARSIDTETAWYLQEDSLAARAIAWRLRQLADEADMLGAETVAEYYIDEAAFRAAAIDAVMGARGDDLAALGL